MGTDSQGENSNDAEAIEKLIEEDPALVPSGPSELLITSLVLEREEVVALLGDLLPQLETAHY